MVVFILDGFKIICCCPQMSRKLSDSTKEGQLKSSSRVPLKDVVADCERRWFEDTLKAAKSGEVDMQSLVGQMFCSGYGVAVDVKQVIVQLWLFE